MRSQEDAGIIKIQKYDGAISMMEQRRPRQVVKQTLPREAIEQWRLTEVVVEWSKGRLGQDHQAVDQEENELENVY